MLSIKKCREKLPEADEELTEQYRSAFGRRPSHKAKESLESYLTRLDRDVMLYALELAGIKANQYLLFLIVSRY